MGFYKCGAGRGFDIPDLDEFGAVVRLLRVLFANHRAKYVGNESTKGNF